MRAAALLVALAVATLSAGGCGDDEEGGGSQPDQPARANVSDGRGFTVTFAGRIEGAKDCTDIAVRVAPPASEEDVQSNSRTCVERGNEPRPGLIRYAGGDNGVLLYKSRPGCPAVTVRNADGPVRAKTDCADGARPVGLVLLPADGRLQIDGVPGIEAIDLGRYPCRRGGDSVCMPEIG